MKYDLCESFVRIQNRPVPDAVPDEHAVVLPLEDAHAADGAVPGARRLHGLADGAELPLLADGRGEDDVARRRVRQPQPDEVAHDVHQELEKRRR